MRFASRHLTHTIVVDPFDKEVLKNGREVPHRGLRAEFRNHNFDSELTQRNLRWSEDQRLEVERRLLESPEFYRTGRTNPGIFLGLDQEIPKEHAEADDVFKCHDTLGEHISEKLGVKSLSEIGEASSDVVSCEATKITADGPTICGAKVVEGTTFCARHTSAGEGEPEEVAEEKEPVEAAV